MHGGGAEYIASILSNYWVRSGHDVYLLATYSGGGKCIYYLDSKVRLLYLSDFIGTTRKSILTKFRRLWILRKLIISYGPDTVISFHAQVNVATILATRALGLQTVVSERTYPPAIGIGYQWHLLRRLLYPFASNVVMQTDKGLNWLKNESPSSKVCRIPNPCIFPLPKNEPFLSFEKGLTKDRLVILSAGRLSEEKGFVNAIKAFSEVARTFTRWDFVILGEGPERMNLCNLISRLQLQERIYLPGRAGNLDDWYDRADVYLMSSRYEGFPNSLMEAMSYGLPVVSFDCDTGPRDLIRDGLNGFLVPPAEGYKGLSKKLELLLCDSDLRQNIGKQAKFVRKKFSLANISRQWERVMGIADRYI